VSPPPARFNVAYIWYALLTSAFKFDRLGLLIVSSAAIASIAVEIPISLQPCLAQTIKISV
jgi:hypothetical protein